MTLTTDTQPLTEKERETLDLLAQGLTRRQVAWRMGISVGGVKKTEYRARRKLEHAETAAR